VKGEKKPHNQVVKNAKDSVTIQIDGEAGDITVNKPVEQVIKDSEKPGIV